MAPTQYYYFTEQPYTGYDPAVQEEHPALRITLPNSLYDSRLASELYNRYHDEYQVADEVGFDGIMINEHHTAPFCMQASINITGAVLAKITRRAQDHHAGQSPAGGGQPAASGRGAGHDRLHLARSAGFRRGARRRCGEPGEQRQSGAQP